MLSRSSMLLLLVGLCSGCFETRAERTADAGHEEDEGGASTDGGSGAHEPVCIWETEYGGCRGPIWRDYEYVEDEGYYPDTEREVEGTWQGIEPVDGEPGAHRLFVDRLGTEHRALVWADVSTLSTLLSVGDRVRLTVAEGALRLHRVSDEALLLAVIDSEQEPAGVLDYLGRQIGGIGASLATVDPCDSVVSFSSFCLPLPARGYSLQVGSTVVGLDETVDVTTETGTFRVTNRTMYGMSSGASIDSECELCAPAIIPLIRVNIIRLE